MPPHPSALLGRLRKLSQGASDAALLLRWSEGRDQTAFADLAPPVAMAAGAGPAPVMKPRAACLALLLVAGLGAGLAFLRAPGPGVLSAADAAQAPAQAKDEPRRDRSGDPLPAGAIARLGTLRFRVPGEIEGLAFASGGETVAVSSGAGVFLLDAASGKRINTLATAHFAFSRQHPVVFSPDGKRLAGRGQVRAGSRFKGVVRVWELAGEPGSRDYDADHALSVGWSARGEPLAVCLEKDGLRFHELASGRSRHFKCKDLMRPELSNYVLCVCTPDGRALAVADERGVVHVWDTATGQERCTLRPKGGNLFSVAVSPDGSKLASATPQALQQWDLSTGRVLFTTDGKDNYRSLFFSADSKVLGAIKSYHTICFLDAATGRERGRTREQYYFAPGFAFSPDGKTLATAERHSGAVHLFDVATGERKPEPAGHGNRPHGAEFSPDGRRVATGGSLDGTVHVWDLATGAALASIRRPNRWVRDVALSPDGRLLYSTWTDDSLWVCDAATGERRHVIKLEDPERPDTYQSAIAMRLSDDGKTLVAFSYYSPKDSQAGQRYQETLITGWDLATRKQLFRRRRPGTDSWTTLSADGRVLAVPHPEASRKADLEVPGLGPMRLEDVVTGEPLLTFPALEGQTWPLAFSPDGRLLASNNSNWKRATRKGSAADTARNTVRLWEVATAAEVLVLPAADNNRAAFSRDGRLLALAAPSGEILVWDLALGRAHQRFKGFGAGVTWLAFAPDGRRLVSGLTDSTLLVWDVGPRAAAPGPRLGGEGVAKAWADLAGADAPLAFRARGALASSPAEAVELLSGRLRPARAADAQRLRERVADLESPQFAVREKAQAGLEELADLAEPALRQALAARPALEVRRRVEAVLDRLRGPVTRPELRRGLRAVAVLEDVGTPAARELLEALASGAPEARLTRAAKASLGRLARGRSASR